MRINNQVSPPALEKAEIQKIIGLGRSWAAEAVSAKYSILARSSVLEAVKQSANQEAKVRARSHLKAEMLKSYAATHPEDLFDGVNDDFKD